jgi:rSAM/selenodomain-associated transferase 1
MNEKAMSKNLLLIFTRNPELGKVKTRLAKTIGEKKALEIYKFLLNHTKKATKNIACDKAVYYSVKVRKNDLWDASTYQKKQQLGEDLGIRMKHAFQDSFAAGYEKVLIVGSDLIDLSEDIIEKGFIQLASNDVVIGPAKDGGYYLLGVKSLPPNIFENKTWGTATVREDTLNDLKDKKVHLLNELNDADIFEDIEEHPAFQHLLK